MLTDTELLDAITNTPRGWTTQTTLLALGRTVEAAVLNKQGRLLRECELAGAAGFAGGVVATGVNAENLQSECGDTAVLTELRAAHQIILNALALMTTAQKIEWAKTNDRDGVIGDGTTRYHERAAVIAAAAGEPRP